MTLVKLPAAPAAPATVAVEPMEAAALVGRRARRRGVEVIVKAETESAVVVEIGIVIDTETVAAEVEIGSVITTAGIIDVVVSHGVGTDGGRIVYAIEVHHLSLGVDMDTVRVLTSERRALSGSHLTT